MRRLSPLLLSWYLIRTVVGAWLIGLGFAVLSGYFLAAIYRSKGSTAAIGLPAE